MKPVRKIVFPVNGMGTRFLPATKAMPKEMLPIIDRPLIQYAVDEAVNSGVTELIFVTGRTKRAIEDHFDYYPELERELENKGKQQLLDLLKGIIPSHVHCIFIRQPKPMGLGHAVLCAKPAIGDEPFGVILADDLIDSGTPCIDQLIKARTSTGGGNILAVVNVTPTETNKYGIVSVDNDAALLAKVCGIVEKPDPSIAPSSLAVIGRYIFEPEIFNFIESTPSGVGGEIQLTDGICSSLENISTYTYRFEGKRFDCGDKQGFIDATVHYARKRGFAIR